MNVDDFDPDITALLGNDGDSFFSMWGRQRELHKKYKEIEEQNGFPYPQNPHLDDPQTQHLIKDFMWRITEELGEAANELHNKPWKTTPHATDETHFKEELMDALHFFLEMLIIVGMTPEEVVQMYFKKSEVNKFRQESDY